MNGQVQEPRFHPIPTLISWGIVILSLGFGLLAHMVFSPLMRVEHPERALLLIINRELELRDAVKARPSWEQRFFEIYDGISNEEDTNRQLIQWQEELAVFSKEPTAHIHLAILEGEIGRLEDLRQRLAGWEKEGGGLLSLFRILVGAAYLDTPFPFPFGNRRWVQPLIHELLPPGELRSRLLNRLEEREILSGPPEEKDPPERGGRIGRIWFMTVVDLFLTACFLWAFWRILRGRSQAWRSGTALIPPPWSGWTSLTVLVRGAAIACLISFLGFFIPVDQYPGGELVFYTLFYFPLLLLPFRYLLKPHGLNFTQTFGLTLPKGGVRRLLIVTFAGMGFELIGNIALDIGANFAEAGYHWGESFDADLVWGSTAYVAAGMAANVLMAPFFEEFIFRGLLFGTLRRRFSWVPTAIISAGVFSILHGYGILGFSTVFLSGVVWAWTYEKSGSLLPGMFAHAVNNLFYSLGLLLLLR
ncbi:MAG: CPBP family intramembrane metalloprotease [Candidatus Omnitrophica bacterium]|nr:CPBP family intramembrane metalloprotease [Candidatus Omnitrophota bacterium]